MTEKMTKAKLLDELRSARQALQDLLNDLSPEMMTQSGATGHWSVKDVITHLTSYARWYVNAAEAQIKGEPPPLDGTENMPFEERNQMYYERDKDMPLTQALEESEDVHQRLLAAMEKIPEPFLIEPQDFPGAPQAVEVWKQLRGDVYAHTRIHIRWIREWLAQSADN